MKTKIFGGKKITIRILLKYDLRNVKKFQDFINSLIDEEVKLALNQRQSIKEEKNWLKKELKNIKNKKKVVLIAEHNSVIIGVTDISVDLWRRNHVSNFSITIRSGYRGIGLGKYLMGEILKLAKKELKPKPKIIRLSVFANHKPAISLYKKYGFKEVARIPKQLFYSGKLIDEVIMLLYL
ncbi:GNAT family N-acetyltransferase [Patescibacteria group bacterium]|nr:GNAT family N-acetyltransferase [Patescibacteria group bacterium]MBU4367813.1 GNAT family N-acetyltransferase [Patescibacteria group bacterium]MBU4461523.1 GNAT family N-acetyltransferase [Patescibacteria group bacterium]MCG2700336.1 GNAT family N-acetyltransferase [Candidatus Parcubacteria bacterium]